MNVTFYNNVFCTEFIDVDIRSLLKQIKHGKWKDKVSQIRAASGDQKKELKKTIPGFTASGTFEGARKAAEISTHSGLIAMDFDDISLDARGELYADPFTFAGFVSVGGAGLCVLVRIDPKRHIDAFLSLEKHYYTSYGFQVDQSCKDVSRLRFVSDDPELFINQDAKVFEKYVEKKKGRKPKIIPVASTEDDVEHVIKQIEANRLDLTSGYDEWIDLGMSLKSHGLSSEAFHRISQFHADYDYDKTERKYKSFTMTGGVSISTFFYYAKQAGLEIKTPQTRQIETVAKWAKKGRRTPEQAIKQLREMDNIPPEKSTQIVNKVFSGEVKPDESEEDIVFQVEQFLNREVEIRYNEVTLKYETKGRAMNDRDFNSCYLDCKKMIPKVTKDLFLSCVDSDRTKTFNPIKEYFESNTHRKSTGSIQKLADSIDTLTGFKDEAFFPEYAYYFLRKWMVGAVAMWYKHNSPLMLVLAGSKQNSGKTHFFRYLLPDELQVYYGEAELTGDKDENLLMCSKMIILNDEMSNKSKRDLTVLKKLCSAQWFNLRKPYGKLSEDFRRISALCGTSNDLSLISDPTGNRRIIPIEVNSIDHDKYNSIDKGDLWLEAYHAYKAGEPWKLNSKDIKILSENTSDFEEASLEAELVMKYFKPADGSRYCSEMTNAEIKSYIEIRTHQRLSARKLGMELKRMGYEQRVVKENRNPKRVYYVHELQGVKGLGE